MAVGKTPVCLLAKCLLLLTVCPAHAQIAALGKGWLLDSAGSITSAPGEVISGKNSIKGSVSGSDPGQYHAFLWTHPDFIHFMPGETYTITFNYRGLTGASARIEFGLFSPTANNQGTFFPTSTVNAAAGTSGTASLTSNVAPYSDVIVGFKVVGNGAIVVDDIRITDSGGRLVVTENADGPALVSAGPLNFQLTDAMALLTDSDALVSGAAAHDLDGDGHPEVILIVDSPRPCNVPLRNPWVIESNARMRIATSDYFPEGAPTLKCSGMILFADINGDGLPDLLFSEAGSDPNGPGGRIGVALNVGGGKYRDVSSLIPADQQDTRSGSIAAGDVYGDGRVEIVLPDSNDGANTALLRWNGNGFDEIRNWVPLSLWKDYPAYLKQQSWMVMSDFDQDGRQDLLVGGQDHNPNFQILFGSAGGFTGGDLVTLPDGPFGHNPGGPVPPVLPTTAEVAPVLVADFNNDGRPDIFAIERQEIFYQPGVYTDTNDPGYAYIRANGGVVTTDSTFQLLLNAGSRRFTEVKSAPTWVNLGRREYTNLYAVDMNNDGFLDVVGVYQTDPYAGVGTVWGTTLFLNDGTGEFQIVDGSELLAAVTTTPSNGHKWNLGAFVPTVVNRHRTEGIVYESVGGCPVDFCPAKGLNLYKVVADGSIGTGPNFVDPAPFGAPGFNEFYYLRHYPDAAAAVQVGQYPTGLAHYLAVGKARGYLPHAPLGIRHLPVDGAPSPFHPRRK